MHGPTFMANPLACAVALASLELLADGERGAARVAAIEEGLREGLEPARELPGVSDVRVLGAIGVIELEHDGRRRRAPRAAAVERGVWLRPFRDLDLRDAAVRDRRGGSGAGDRRDGRGRERAG